MMAEYRDTGYFCDKNGCVYNKDGKEIYIHIGKLGYPKVEIWKNNKRKHIHVHRIVAESLIPNPENKPQVNHINGIKTDNRIENLEWCTGKENMVHASKLGLTTKGREATWKFNTKFNEDEHILIALCYFVREMPVKLIAENMGTRPNLIWNAIKRVRENRLWMFRSLSAENKIEK
jgi:hypothetical protein